MELPELQTLLFEVKNCFHEAADQNNPGMEELILFLKACYFKTSQDIHTQNKFKGNHEIQEKNKKIILNSCKNVKQEVLIDRIISEIGFELIELSLEETQAIFAKRKDQEQRKKREAQKIRKGTSNFLKRRKMGGLPEKSELYSANERIERTINESCEPN